MNGATQKTHAQTYALRFRRVLDFVDAHLDEPLTVERLSQVAHFSKFHFHRQFADYVGMTPSRYVAQARLRRASYRLAFNPLEPITEIALQAGYERPESFSRAFKDTFGQSPSAFRKNPDWATWNAQFHWITRQETDAMQVRIVTTEPVLVAVLEHRGDPALLNASVQTFIAWRRESGLSPVNSSDMTASPTATRLISDPSMHSAALHNALAVACSPSDVDTRVGTGGINVDINQRWCSSNLLKGWRANYRWTNWTDRQRMLSGSRHSPN